MGAHRVRFLAAITFTLALCLPAGAATITVAAGGNLQAAIDNAAAGDTILLQAGATFTGNFVVRSGKVSLTLRSSAADSLLPAAGQRTSPQYAAYLPKLQSPNNAAALTIEPGASYITLLHVEVPAASNGSSNLIELGFADSRQATASQAPHHLVLDRILMNIPEGVPQRRGVALNSGDTVVRNSYLYGLKFDGADAQAICGWNGPGPFLIENNRLTASGENVLFGGADPSIPYLVPSNIRVLRNHLDKPLSWKGTVWDVKNIFELKNAQDVVIEGNLFENNWLAAQVGFSILFTPRNQDGRAPWSVVQRVVFRNNVVRHVSGVFNILGRDNIHPSEQTNDILIENNLFHDVDWSAYGGTGRLMQIDGADNVRVRHNTSPHNDGQAVYAVGHQTTRFMLENNLLNAGNYGIHGEGTAPGNGTLATWLPGALVLGNVVVAAPAYSYPIGNYYPATWGAVEIDSTFRLLATSPYLAAGTGGTPVGANIDAIDAALGGTLPPAPPGPGPCTFTVTPLSHNSPASGDAFAVGVTASAASCAWSAAGAGWVAPSLTAGTGSGTVTLTVSPNGTTTQRTANVMVAGSAVAVTQPAPAVAPVCAFTLSPSSVKVLGGGTTFAATLTAAAPSCGWTASTGASWIRIASTSGAGTATLSITVAATTTNGPRNATITAGGQTLTVQQNGRRKK